MVPLRIFGIVIFAVLIMSIYCYPDDDDNDDDFNLTEKEKEVKKYLKSIDSQYKEVQTFHYDHLWSDDKAPERGLLALLRSIILSEEVANKLKQYDYKNFEAEDIKRQSELLVRAGGYMSNEENELIQIIRSLVEIGKLASNKGICDYEEPETCDKGYIPFAIEVMAKSNNASELLHYWTQFRDKFGAKGKKLLSTYAELFAKGAKISGYEKPSHMYYAEFDTDDLIEKFEIAIEKIKPLYQELHAHVHEVLLKEHGEEVLRSNGTIPQHLLEHMILEAFKADANIHFPYPKEPMPNITEYLQEKMFSSQTLLEKCISFYTSVGFDELPEDFLNDQTKPLDTEGYVCSGEVFPALSDVAGYKYCPSLDLRSYLQMHYDTASVFYDQLYRKLPAAYATEAAPGFGKAVGEAVALSAISPKHLNEVLGLAHYSTYKANINRLYRLATYFVFSIYQRFIEEKLWVKILNGEISVNDYNFHYWKMQYDYARIDSPNDRDEDKFDVSVYFYSKFSNNLNTQYLLSEITGFDIYQALCKITNEYLPENTNEKPLHNCDLYGKKLVGYVLEPTLAQGKKQPWFETLHGINVDVEKLGEGIVHYFQPLYEWLKADNLKKHLDTHWDIESLDTTS